MAVGGVQLGVQVLGDAAGLKASLTSAVAAADLWAEATEAAGVRAARSIELTGVAARQAEIAYAKMGLAVSKYAQDTVGAQAAAVRYEATVQGLYERQIAMADAAAAAQERASVKFQASMMSAGRTLSTYVTLPLAAAGYASIKLATEFQASMTRVQTYAGASAQEVRRQTQNILNNASMLPQGPIKAAEALYHLESIGIRGARALEALKAASIAAGAGQANLTDATTALGGALVANIKGAQDAKTAMAGLISIAGQGNMTMQNLTDALGTGLLVKAGNIGISLHEVGAALDVLVDRGIPARRAATYLGTTFALMVAPSQAAKTAAEDLGVSWEKMGSMLQQPGGLMKVLEMFHERVQAVGQTRGMRDVMDMFGRSRQSTGIQTLIESFNAPVSSYAQKIQQYQASVRQATERMNAYQQTAQFKMHSALSVVEADLIKIGTGAAPAVADAMGAAAHTVDDFVRAFEKLPGPIKDALGGMVGVLAVIGPIMLGIGGIMKLSRGMGSVMRDLGMLPKKAAADEAAAGLASLGAEGAGAATGIREIGIAFSTLPADAREGVAGAASALAELPLTARVTAAEAGAAFAGFASAYRAEITDASMQASVAMAEVPASARAATLEAAAAFAELPVAARASIAEMRTTFGEPAVYVAQEFSQMPAEARAAAVEVGAILSRIPAEARESVAQTIAAFAELPVEVRAAVAKATTEVADSFAAVPLAARKASAEAAASFSTLTAASRDGAISIAGVNTEMAQTTGIATDTAAAVRSVGDAFASMGVMAEEGTAAAAAGLGRVATEAEIASASTAGLGVKGMIGSGLGLLGRSSMYAIGGMIAGQTVSAMVPGQGGHVAGDVITGAGVGAGAGVLAGAAAGAMGLSEFGPLGIAAGAGLGALAFGLKDIIGLGGPFVDSVTAAGRSLEMFRRDAAITENAIAVFRRNVANDKVTVDQWKQSVQQAAAAVRQTIPGTAAHARAVDQLNAAEQNLRGAVAQLGADTGKLTQKEAQHAEQMKKEKKAAKDWADQLNLVAKSVKGIETAAEAGMTGRASIPFMMQQAQNRTQSADQQLQNYVDRLTQLARSAQSSDPMLAQVYRNLIKIAEAVNGIPDSKEVHIVIDETINRHFHVFGDTGMGPHHDAAWMAAIAKAEAAATAKAGGPKPLSTEQGIQVALAKNPNDRDAIEAQMAYDRGLIAQYKKQRAEGKIGPQQYVDLVTAAYQDLNQMKQQLASISKKANKAQTAFEKKVRSDELLAKARLDLENGQYAAGQALLRKDKARLELLLKEAKTQDERLAVQRQLLEVEKLMKSKVSGFALSMKLQEQMARADALAALDPNRQGPTALQLRLAKEAKAQAMKVINSHNATLQALIDAWNIVGQANATIAQAQNGVKANLYHAVSTDTAADAVKGLTATQEMQLREAMAQRDAHRGNAPNNPAADGYGAGSAYGGPGPRGSVITFNGAKIEVHGIQDVRKLMAELERMIRQKYGRTGHRR